VGVGTSTSGGRGGGQGAGAGRGRARSHQPPHTTARRRQPATKARNRGCGPWEAATGGKAGGGGRSGAGGRRQPTDNAGRAGAAEALRKRGSPSRSSPDLRAKKTECLQQWPDQAASRVHCFFKVQGEADWS
jgi:hypothetical protein